METPDSSPDSPSENGTENGLQRALRFLQDNFILIGIAAVVVIAIFMVVVKPGSSSQAAAPTPSVTATAGAAKPASKPTSSATATATPTATATNTASAEPSAASDSPSATETEVPLVGAGPQNVEVQNWRRFAEKFGQAYGNTAGGKDAWLARMRPYITDSLYEGFSVTDISRVEKLTFSGVNKMVEENAYSTFTVNYKEKPEFIDGLIQVQNDGSWKVAKVAKHEK